MKMKILLLLILLSVFLPQAVMALDIEIQINKSFSIGEIASFEYAIRSDADTSISYMVMVQCPSAPIPLSIPISEYLVAGESLTKNYTYLTVDETIEPQTCTANIQILSPEEQTVSKEFKIVTNPSFSFNINICQDSSCIKKAKIFIKSENIYLDYVSDVDSPLITASLIYPDKTTEQISLPTSIKAEQLGTCTLDVEASKDGYKIISQKEQFAVIAKHAEITSGAEPEITAQDNTGKVTEKITEMQLTLWQIIGIALGVIIGIILIILGILSYLRSRRI